VMGEHDVFPRQAGKIHPKNGTPHIAITTYIVIMFLIPATLEIVTNPVTTFGDAGTLAAWGFLAAYFWISVAAPVYLKKRGELRARHVVITALACLCLLVPTVGSFYPVPPFPVDIFPYLFLAYMAIGGTWLYVAGRRHRDLFTEIEADLEATLAIHEQRAHVPAGPLAAGPEALPSTT
jgi:amino acid transporter